MKATLVILALALSCLIHESTALRCYECSGCGNSFGTDTLCPSTSTACQVNKYSIKKFYSK